MLVAVAVACGYQLPGNLVSVWLSSTSVHVEVPVKRPPVPVLPKDLPGLRHIGCSPSRMELPATHYERARSVAPDAIFFTCRFDFAQPQSQLLATELSGGGMSIDALLNASLGPALVTDYSAVSAWTTREVLLGSETLLRAVPWATQLLLALLAAWWLRLGLRSDLYRVWANRHAGVKWPLLSLFVAPTVVALPVLEVRRWLGADASPLLQSIGFPHLPPQSMLGDVFQYMVSAPVTEELIYRVWMIPFLARGMNPHLAVAFSSALFAYGHGHSYLAYFASGLAFGYLWHYGRSPTLCIGAHALSNSTTVSAPLLRSLIF